ncbi:unnamed protein product [Brugia pahangi]|uniref:Uncharacterized protein n=1 Tax=Brugia pahangi TaxID=6280 RepID=A0A0N4TYV6_BRUPA|nr:unnamed protein product [Brugia pahangi]
MKPSLHQLFLRFEAFLSSTDQFGEEMKVRDDLLYLNLTLLLQKLGFFTNLTESFQKFAENYENTFINRHCSKIINEGELL